MISPSLVSPPKGPLLPYSSFNSLFRLIHFLPSLILYKYLRVLPSFSPKFLFSAFVPVLTLPDFQTPSDLDQPKPPKFPRHLSLPKITRVSQHDSRSTRDDRALKDVVR
jgi:hypothetical protein